MRDWNNRERRADELDDEPQFGSPRGHGAYGQGEYGRGHGDEGYLTPGPGGYDRSGRYRQSPGYGSASQVGGQGYGGGYGQGYGGAGYREEMGYEREGPYRSLEHGNGGGSRRVTEQQGIVDQVDDALGG